MPSTSRINLNVEDQTFSPQASVKGIVGYLGIFQRGPLGRNDEIFSSWPRFKKVYGGLINTSDDPLIVKRMLDRGTKVRVCGVRHFTDISDPTSFDGVIASNLNTDVHTLDDDLVAGDSVNYTIGATTVAQAFDTSSKNTLELLAAKIKATFANVDSVYVKSARIIQVSKTSGVGVLDATGVGSPNVADSTLNGFRNAAGTELFTIKPKNPGINYNNLKVSSLPASNGSADSFDIRIEMVGEGDYEPEVYRNIKIPGNPTIVDSHYLDDIIKGNDTVKVEYKDLSGIATLPILPQVNYSRYSGGTNGGAVTDVDYLGDAGAKNGLHAFDNVSDILAIGTTRDTDAMAVGGAAYGDTRKDLQYFHHFPNNLITPATITAAKDALLINTPYIEFWTGGLNVLDPLTNTRRDISAIGDILAASALSEASVGAWWSFAGVRRGRVINAFGVVNNFGSASDLTSLDILANHQINAVVNVDGEIYLSGNFSGQLAQSHLSYNNSVRLIIFIKKTLKPILKPYIEQPNDVPTWKEIYLTVKGALDPLKGTGRAIYDYDWQGDQFAHEDMSNLKINTAQDVGQGKYRAKLFVKDIVSLQDMGIGIVITESDVSFEDSLAEAA